ncbi:unnamed protein product [Microthlaspi erraticum]|uniref:Essential protein Yae1 N-terminal domain-containing protein n=1 Tax=Microthlaspi erraticum TaxID=1685480 RepID=A0A6D2K1F4_9BRAS|nr:unnamed protein product [Microthlaspi erraticum]
MSPYKSVFILEAVSCRHLFRFLIALFISLRSQMVILVSLYGESLQLWKPRETNRNDDHSLENLDGSLFGSSDEEEPSDTYPLNKDTEKMLEEFHMSGYRDGIIAGKEAASQQGYNIGYKESVLDGYKFGIVRGVVSALAFLPNEVREKLVDEQETRDEFQKLHGSVHCLSTEAAMKLFYGTLITKQGEDKSGEEGSDSGLGLGYGSVSGSGVAATTDLGSYVAELRSLLDKSPKIYASGSDL